MCNGQVAPQHAAILVEITRTVIINIIMITGLYSAASLGRFVMVTNRFRI